MVDQRLWNILGLESGRYQAELQVPFVADPGVRSWPEVLTEPSNTLQVAGKCSPVEAEEKRVPFHFSRVARTPPPSRWGKELEQPLRRGLFILWFNWSAEELARSDLTCGLCIHLEQIRADPDIVIEEYDKAVVNLRHRAVEGLALVGG